MSGRGEAGEAWTGPFGLGKVNLTLLGAALVAIVAGYLMLDRGSVTGAPMLLVLGYVVLLPAGLLWGYSRSDEDAA